MMTICVLLGLAETLEFGLRLMSLPLDLLKGLIQTREADETVPFGADTDPLLQAVSHQFLAWQMSVEAQNA